jgi:uncharacterized protein YndB with AHSA1/START domain
MEFERDQVGSDADRLGGEAVRREIIVPVGREQAWEALRDAAGLSRWLADDVELEVREGASGKLRWSSGEERVATVEEVERGRRVALRWARVGGEESLVELTLHDVDGGTKIVVIEMPLLMLEAVSEIAVQSVTSAGPSMLALAA